MSEADRHREVVELLPWYVNGTLAGRDFAVVAAHVSGCPVCRDEAAQCQTLAAAVQSAPDAAGAPAADRLGRVLATIDALEADRRHTGSGAWSRVMEWLRDLFQRTPGPMRWALAVQAALLIVLVVLAAGPGVLAPRAPYHTLADVLDAARAKPGTLTMASIGPGSPFHLGFEKLKRMAKADMTFIPYPGNGPSVNALLGDHVTMMFGTYANVAEHLKTGRLRAIAATTRKRFEELPDLPTVAGSGFPDYQVPAWFAAFAPAQTPHQMVSELAGWLTAAMQAAEVKQKLLIQGLYPSGLCGEQLAIALRTEFEDLGRIIRESHIKAE